MAIRTMSIQASFIRLFDEPPWSAYLECAGCENGLGAACAEVAGLCLVSELHGLPRGVKTSNAAGTRLVSCSDNETRDQKAPRIETMSGTAIGQTPDVDCGDRGRGSGRLRRLANVDHRLRRETADVIDFSDLSPAQKR